MRSLAAIGLLIAVGLSAAARPARAEERTVRLLQVDGVIGPVVVDHLKRGLRVEPGREPVAIVVQLDTPGGLASSMREAIHAIAGAPVPVVVYVAPSGARAASAGMFLTLAAHVAAMAPGTNIGAAHPVSLGGGEERKVMESKVVNDAAALARSLAESHGRNAAWAERAVRDSVSLTAAEAERQRVVDLTAPSLDVLLERIDGRTVIAGGVARTIRTAGARLDRVRMPLTSRVLQTITDPTVAYVLFVLGAIALVIELSSPGVGLPGIAGVILLVLAFVAFGSLPLNWAGLALLVLGVGLLVAEIATAGIGVLAAGGVAAFVLGSLLLYRPSGDVSPALPAIGVSPWLIGLVTAVISGFILLVVRAAWRARRLPPAGGLQGVVGRTAVARSDLRPTGTVDLEGERWTATAEGEPVAAGEEVIVVGVDGLTLKVMRGPLPQGA